MLRTAPSFSIFADEDPITDELPRTATIGENIEPLDFGDDFSFSKKGMEFIDENGDDEEDFIHLPKNLNVEGDQVQPASPPLYLATGLGIDAFAFSANASERFHFLSFENFDDSSDAEEYFRNMLDQYPFHPFLLGNYAKLFEDTIGMWMNELESKGNLHDAEEFYLQATLADPEDIEILLRYAQLVWKLHRNRDKAVAYFERAAQSAPHDSYVLAAYASFLWEIDGDGENDEVENQINLSCKEENDGGRSLKSAIKVPDFNVEGEQVEPASPPMYLATGLGIDAFAFSGDVSEYFQFLSPEKFDGSRDAEEYFRNMLDQYPLNPFLLRNYAQLLQSQGNLHEAEKVYLQATQADPEDSEILLHYAKLVWELHHDRDKAAAYFERAAQSAPHDSYVLAAYASFLWEIEGDGENDEVENQINSSYKEKNGGRSLKPVIKVPDFDPVDPATGDSVDQYYKNMVKENPSNPLFLRNYAQFLCLLKGDLHAAEEYYTRAIELDPSNGTVLSEHAKLMWELHHDHNKASSCFQRAIEASPGDSHVLAAYACFLWETGEEQDH